MLRSPCAFEPSLVAVGGARGTVLGSRYGVASFQRYILEQFNVGGDLRRLQYGALLKSKKGIFWGRMKPREPLSGQLLNTHV